MSTLKNNITAQRIQQLAQKGEVLFHTKDLANLWQISHPNTLRVTLKRYVQSGLLNRIHRGFYSLVPLNQIDPLLLGAKAIHQFCYLSLQSVLYPAGYVSQPPSAHTFVSEKSKRFQMGDYKYIGRQLAPQFLYHPEGIEIIDAVQRATPERAIVDMLYFNPKVHFDKKIPWKKIRAIQQKIGYPLTPHRYLF